MPANETKPDSVPSNNADGSAKRDEELTPQQRARLYPRVTSFRSRRGSLTPAQQHNWETIWPQLGRDVDETPIDVDAWFGRNAPTIMEIGCGTGTSTAAMAAQEPQYNVIAVEVYRPGMAQLLGLIDRGGLTNIRMVRGDAVIALRHMVGEGSLAGMRVFFPDPWPKARHHKRRLLQGGTFTLMARALADNAILHIATDHADYAEHIAEELANQDVFVPLEGDSPISLARPVTKFEGRAEREGRTVTEYVLSRSER